MTGALAPLSYIGGSTKKVYKSHTQVLAKALFLKTNCLFLFSNYRKLANISFNFYTTKFFTVALNKLFEMTVLFVLHVLRSLFHST
jgi:hypothetical protein